jgi:ATP-dependent RNA helicase DOB1
MADIEITPDEAAAPSKRPRLNDDRVAALPTGSNLIERGGKSCTHEVAWPPGVDGSCQPPPASSRPPARTYPFQIDPFQETAIRALEAGHSVLVSIRVGPPRESLCVLDVIERCLMPLN